MFLFSRFLPAVFLLFFSTKVFPQDSLAILNNLKQHVSFLAHDSLEGRLTASRGETIAADYIIRQFESIGLIPKGENGWLHPFSFNANKINKDPHGDNPHHEEESSPIYKIGNNVIGFIDNRATNTIVIGAHYDHLGYGEFGSLNSGEPAIHNGADDNASGVAALIELARRLSQSNLTANNYLFIAFSGEELGLFGSKSFIEKPTVPVSQINYMLNYDMVGRLNPAEKKLGLNGVGTAINWKIYEKIKVNGLQFKTTESGIGSSDHTSFYLANIPAIHLFTGTHDDYHKPSDDEEKINYGGIYSVIKFTYTLIDSLNNDGKLNFITTKNEETESVPRFTVTLGVIPDYMFDGKGMRIDGIREGKPAALAGMQKGDVVIQIGSAAVNDMMSYMKGLSQFKAGDKTVVKAIRGDKMKKFKVRFQ